MQTIFVDGACFKTNAPGGYAAIMSGEIIVSGFVPDTTLNIMELSAILHTLRYVLKNKNSFKSVIINSASKYAVSMSTGHWELEKFSKNKNLIMCIHKDLEKLKSLGIEVYIAWAHPLSSSELVSANKLANELASNGHEIKRKKLKKSNKYKHTLERNEKNLHSGKYKSRINHKFGTGGGGKPRPGKKCKLKSSAVEEIIERLKSRDS